MGGWHRNGIGSGCSMATTREQLRALLEQVPDDRLDEARAALALLNVPEDDEPLTDEELESIREGRIAYARGETIPHDEAMRRLGLQ